MVNSIPISLSGLNASQNRLLAASSNIANLRTADVNPVTVVQKSINTGKLSGIQSTIITNNNNFTAISNISLETEIVNLISAEITYKANAFALKTAQEIEQSLIDELA